MRRLRIGPDYSDPETRRERHEQKVINWIRENSPDTFKDWLEDYLWHDDDAIDIFDKVSALLRENFPFEAPGEYDGRRKKSGDSDKKPVREKAGSEPNAGPSFINDRVHGKGGSPPEPWNWTEVLRGMGDKSD